MFKARELMVFYENMLALNSISLGCEEGRIVGIFGANSAGKSTLMYSLSGIMLDMQRKEAMAGGGEDHPERPDRIPGAVHRRFGAGPAG